MTTRKPFILSIWLLISVNILIGQCPVNNTFESQSQIDSFPSEFPNCIHFENSIQISETNVNDPINNLDSLIQIESCNGLNILGTPHLVSIKGLSSLTDTLIYGIEIDEAPILESLEGLEGITSVKIEFRFENIPKVTSLLPFKNLINVDDIQTAITLINTGVTSLAGISQIIPNDNTIRLTLLDNPNLETCNVKFACDFLENLVSCNGNFHLIENNAPGCNSKEEILASCETLGTDPDNAPFHDLKIYPNPVSDRLVIEASEPIAFTLLNNVGQVVFYQDDTQRSHLLDTQSLLPGIYYVKIFNAQRFVFKRVVVE